jgi:hypothetical protein
VRLLADVKSLVTIADADVRLVSLVNATIVQGEPSQIESRIPPGYEVSERQRRVARSVRRAAGRRRLLMPIPRRGGISSSSASSARRRRDRSVSRRASRPSRGAARDR